MSGSAASSTAGSGGPSSRGQDSGIVLNNFRTGPQWVRFDITRCITEQSWVTLERDLVRLREQVASQIPTGLLFGESYEESKQRHEQDVEVLQQVLEGYRLARAELASFYAHTQRERGRGQIDDATYNWTKRARFHLYAMDNLTNWVRRLLRTYQENISYLNGLIELAEDPAAP